MWLRRKQESRPFEDLHFLGATMQTLTIQSFPNLYDARSPGKTRVFSLGGLPVAEEGAPEVYKFLVPAQHSREAQTFR